MSTYFFMLFSKTDSKFKMDNFGSPNQNVVANGLLKHHKTGNKSIHVLSKFYSAYISDYKYRYDQLEDQKLLLSTHDQLH